MIDSPLIFTDLSFKITKLVASIMVGLADESFSSKFVTTE